MRLAVRPENVFESVAMGLGLVPNGLIEAWLAPVIGRVWIAAVRLGLFDALAEGPLDAATVASRCGTGANGTKALLDAMAGVGALQRRDNRYGLTASARKWFVRGAEHSVADFVDFLGVQWDWLEHLEEYVRSDRPMNIHTTMGHEQWDAYQRGMRAAANFIAPELAKRIPVPAGARRMLDIGGSHGFYSVSICRRHEGLTAEVLDLPAAVAAAAPILARERMGERVRHRAGDALRDEFGDGEYDLILMSDLVHHFHDADNRKLAGKCARALAPGGMLVIKDVVRGDDSARPRQMPLLGALGVMMISESTMWTVAQMSEWLTAAGLRVRPSIPLRAAPGVVMVVGQRAA